MWKYQTLKILPRLNQAKPVSDTETRSIVREVKANPVSRAVQISKDIVQISGKSIKASTIRRTLRSAWTNTMQKSPQIKGESTDLAIQKYSI